MVKIVDITIHKIIYSSNETLNGNGFDYYGLDSRGHHKLRLPNYTGDDGVTDVEGSMWIGISATPSGFKHFARNTRKTAQVRVDERIAFMKAHPRSPKSDTSSGTSSSSESDDEDPLVPVVSPPAVKLNKEKAKAKKERKLALAKLALAAAECRGPV